MHIWNVKYKSIFSSSSGNDRYSKESNAAGYICTDQPTIDAVQKKLELILGRQYRVLSLEGTIYMGKLLDE